MTDRSGRKIRTRYVLAILSQLRVLRAPNTADPETTILTPETRTTSDGPEPTHAPSGQLSDPCCGMSAQQGAVTSRPVVPGP